MNWDHRNPDAMIEVVEELLQHYKVYQERIVEVNSRLKFQYNSLFDGTDENMENMKIERRDIEVYCHKTEVFMFIYCMYVNLLSLLLNNIGMGDKNRWVRL